MLNNKVNPQNIFDLEKLRDKFAVLGDLNRFRKTYGSPLKIKDLNTNEFWNSKMDIDQKKLNKSQIYLSKLKIVSNIIKNKKGRLLDIGFGQGFIEKLINKEERIKKYGIDISTKAVLYAQKYFNGEYLSGSVFKIPFKSLMFDYILALDVIEHISHKKIFFAYSEINRVLKKNGYLIISVPLNEALEDMVSEGRNPNGHMRVYTENILKTELKLINYKIIETYLLYAFNSFYHLKTLVMKLSPIKFKKPNLLILVAQKI